MSEVQVMAIDEHRLLMDSFLLNYATFRKIAVVFVDPRILTDKAVKAIEKYFVKHGYKKIVWIPPDEKDKAVFVSLY